MKRLFIHILLAVGLVIVVSCDDMQGPNTSSPDPDVSDNSDNSGDDAGNIDESDDSGDESAAGSENNTDNAADANNENTAAAELKSQIFTASAENILNPERGFYTWIDILDDTDNYNWVREDGFTLAYAEVVLDGYQNSALDDPILNGLAAGFERVKNAGIKVILRFYYSDDPLNSDAPQNQILSHIAQLKPILQNSADVISTLQAGFIGRWGEWHTSTNGLDNEASRAAVLNALLDALPSSVTIQVRKPSFKTDFIGSDAPLDETEAYNGEAKSRVAHHNDCFLASNTDYGTYPSGEITKWKDYIAADANFVPMGGETCKLNPPRSDCATALSEMEQLHWSFINILYHPDVINAWKTQGCFEEIERRLGYHLALTDITWNPKIRPGGILHFEANIKNDGFAAPYNEYSAYLILQGAKCYRADLNYDPRSTLGGTTSFINSGLRLPADIGAGSYALQLLITDAFQSIRLANEGLWIENSGVNGLGQNIEVDASATDYTGTAESAFEECP
ncbi:MAG: DUF4832 domain-containing protein [Deltaproteobacteria bacterium]|nr:DUF4832 domain-containing protein [Deltaproteobacteria bacterium]